MITKVTMNMCGTGRAVGHRGDGVPALAAGEAAGQVGVVHVADEQLDAHGGRITPNTSLLGMCTTPRHRPVSTRTFTITLKPRPKNALVSPLSTGVASAA